MDRGRDADGSRDKESGPHKAKGEHSTLSSKSGGGDSVSMQKYHLPQPTPPLGQSRSSDNVSDGDTVSESKRRIRLTLPRLASNDDHDAGGLISGLSTH